MRKIIISFIIGIALVMSTVAVVKADRYAIGEYPNFMVLTGLGTTYTLQNGYNYVITDFSPRRLLSENEIHKTRYEVYRVIGGNLVLQQNRTYNIVTNASGYFNMGYVGSGEIDIADCAYEGNVKYTGWVGTQRYITSTD